METSKLTIGMENPSLIAIILSTEHLSSVRKENIKEEMSQKANMKFLYYFFLSEIQQNQYKAVKYFNSA